MFRFDGYVIVSVDGMIANARGIMPASIRHDSDQKFFQDALDRAAVVVHGRHSHEGGPRAARRKRLILTRQIADIAPDESHPHSLFWNPMGAPIEQALKAIGVADGTIAIIGGTEVFSMFLPRYDEFHLSRAGNARIAGGRPVFAAVGPNATPEDVLVAHGLKPGERRILGEDADVSVVAWSR